MSTPFHPLKSHWQDALESKVLKRNIARIKLTPTWERH